KRAGIALRLPCVNRSRLEFTLDDGAIRVGLSAVTGLQDALRVAIVRERDRDGPYRDLSDLRRRASPGPEALAGLDRCGALDFTTRSRPALVLEARLQDRGGFSSRAGSVSDGQKPSLTLPAPGPKPGELFAHDPTEGWSPPDDPPERRWRDEWETLGF